MRKRKLKIIYVQWYDIEIETEWQEEKKVDKPYRGAACHSVGFLLREDKDSIRLGMTTSEDKHWREVKTIPTGCIVKKVVIGCTDPFKE